VAATVRGCGRDGKRPDDSGMRLIASDCVRAKLRRIGRCFTLTTDQTRDIWHKLPGIAHDTLLTLLRAIAVYIIHTAIPSEKRSEIAGKTESA
jgi:hypothetical protein